MTLAVPRLPGAASDPAGATSRPGSTVTPITDRWDRLLSDLRISVTDRCNFRCPYCMPRDRYGPGYHFLAGDEHLTAAEIGRLAGIFVDLGVSKIRLTGGEPLLRPDLLDIVRRLRATGVGDLALTTNGALLDRWAAPLAEAGLRRVTISLDSLDSRVFAAMSDSHVSVSEVLRGIASARAARLAPIKLNCVVRRGINQGSLLGLVEFAREQGLALRFIEFMDVGTSNGWRRQDVVTLREIVEIVGSAHRLVEQPREPGAVARRYSFADGEGELGVVASVSLPFCGDCSRARLGSDGRLYTCLFAVSGLELRRPLRDGTTDAELRRLVIARWQRRADRYSEIRSSLAPSRQRIEMSYIGG